MYVKDGKGGSRWIDDDKMRNAIAKANKVILSKEKDFAIVEVKGTKLFLDEDSARAWHILRTLLIDFFSEEHLKNKTLEKGLNSLKMKNKITDNVCEIFKEGLKIGIQEVKKIWFEDYEVKKIWFEDYEEIEKKQ